MTRPHAVRRLAALPLWAAALWAAALGAAALGAAALGATALGACGGSGADGEAGGRRPDVVLVLVDTLRGDRLSCDGFERPTTPTLDALAAEGARFEDVTAQAPWTLPSMVSLLHGRYVTAERDALEPEWPTLVESFRDAGYTTIGIVSNAGMREGGSFKRGFHAWDVRTARGPDGDWLGTPRDVEGVRRDVAEVLDAVGVAGEDRAPVFLYVHLMDVHMPYEPRPAYDDEVPPAGAGPPMPRPWQREAFAAAGPPAPPDDPGWASRWAYVDAERGRYDQGVRYVDEGIARLLDDLRARGLLDHAVVAVASDHGECLWERVSLRVDDDAHGELPPDRFFYRAHGGFLTQELVRTPLVLWGAGVPAGVVSDAPVENVDLYPTLLELCDLPVPGGLHGRSLVPLLHGAGATDRRHVFSFTYHASAVRELATGWKLVLPNPGDVRFEIEPQLYHLPTDPEERTNRHADEPAVAARLAAVLEGWRRAHPTRPRVAAPDSRQMQLLRELGYTEEDIGR